VAITARGVLSNTVTTIGFVLRMLPFEIAEGVIEHQSIGIEEVVAMLGAATFLKTKSRWHQRAGRSDRSCVDPRSSGRYSIYLNRRGFRERKSDLTGQLGDGPEGKCAISPIAW